MHWPSSIAEFGIINGITAVAIIMNIAGYLMKTMIPLRLVAMTTNALFIAYSTLALAYPTLILNCMLLPINAFRFFQMKRLINQVNNAANGDLSMECFTTKKAFTAGTFLFRKGDTATEMHFAISGRYRVAEAKIELGGGSIIGELGLLEPGKTRTATVECIEGGETLAISYDQVMQLYFQNPTFGFYFLQLSTARLFHSIKGLEIENADLRSTNARLESTLLANRPNGLPVSET